MPEAPSASVSFFVLLLAMASSSQREKSSAERRAQRDRAEARRLQHTLRDLAQVHHHRAGRLTRLGEALHEALATQPINQRSEPTCPHNLSQVAHAIKGIETKVDLAIAMLNIYIVSASGSDEDDGDEGPSQCSRRCYERLP